MSTAGDFDGLVRELYLGAKQGPLRLVLAVSFPPWVEAGATLRFERGGLEGVGRGDLLAVRHQSEEVGVLRYVGRDGATVLGLVEGEVLRTDPERVIGRAIGVEGADGLAPLDTSPADGTDEEHLALAELQGRRKHQRESDELKGYLTSLYQSVTDSFEGGEALTGDILVTDRCPVGCRFCLYSCVTEGSDMAPEEVARAAAELKRVGVKRVRIVGGEPFVSRQMALESYRAVAGAGYAPEAISIITSGFWGSSEELVKSRLDPVAAEGLAHLMLSFDAFHIERYPVDNYERILVRASELGIDAQLSVHYSEALAEHLPRLIELRQRYPFQLRLMTVSKEGRALELDDSELSVAGIEEFRRALTEQSGVVVSQEDSSCFRWTLFPGGDVHFCCKQDSKNRVGNLNDHSLTELRRKLQDLTAVNRRRVAEFSACQTADLSWNPCMSCPLKAT